MDQWADHFFFIKGWSSLSSHLGFLGSYHWAFFLSSFSLILYFQFHHFGMFIFIVGFPAQSVRIWATKGWLCFSALGGKSSSHGIIPRRHGSKVRSEEALRKRRRMAAEFIFLVDFHRARKTWIGQESRESKEQMWKKSKRDTDRQITWITLHPPMHWAWRRSSSLATYLGMVDYR